MRLHAHLQPALLGDELGVGHEALAILCEAGRLRPQQRERRQPVRAPRDPRCTQLRASRRRLVLGLTGTGTGSCTGAGTGIAHVAGHIRVGYIVGCASGLAIRLTGSDAADDAVALHTREAELEQPL